MSYTICDAVLRLRIESTDFAARRTSAEVASLAESASQRASNANKQHKICDSCLQDTCVSHDALSEVADQLFGFSNSIPTTTHGRTNATAQRSLLESSTKQNTDAAGCTVVDKT